MKPDTSATIFDAYNARFATPERVAETFIASRHFWQLCEPCHSLVVGPRGSGKTSMLKMLQTRALRSWKHVEASATFSKLDFVGVFIPTDVLWDEQTKKLGIDYLSEIQQAALVESAIALHVMRCFVLAIIDEFIPETIHKIAGPRGTIKVRKEQEVVNYLSDSWGVTCGIPSFKGLFLALTKRITELGFFVAKERFRQPEGRDERFAESGLIFPTFLDLLRPGIESVNDALGNPDQKWALCFDELELAPVSLQNTLIRYLRSTEQKVYFKLSISPYTRSAIDLAESPTKPEESDDFNLIPLWYAEKRQSAKFSAELAEVFLREAGRLITDPYKVFGTTAKTDDDGTTSYSAGSRNLQEIYELSEKDAAFRKYLEIEKIDVDKISEMTEAERARLIRKVMPVIVHRNYFRRFSGGKKKQQELRSRKSLALYTGWDAIAAICEGNPRMLKGLVTNMIRSSGDRHSVKRSIQWAEIEEARHRFRTKLKTIAITAAGRDRGVLRLLDVVGNYFENELLGPHFIVEPSSSFILDNAAAVTFTEAVGSALNSGALVFLPGDRSKLILGSLKEKRFRLSYLMATHYHIPLRIGPGVTLTTIFSRDRRVEQQLLLPDHE